VFKRGASPSSINTFPLMIGIHIHIMERGIKGVRLINNLLFNRRLDTILVTDLICRRRL
jgi:hypothetical protein